MTLSQTAVITKQVIVITLFTLVLGVVSFIGYKIWYAYYLANLPPVEEKPDTKFGLLPPPDFPPSPVSSSNFSYSIDTSTGNLPKVGIDVGFEKLIKVYFVTKTFASLLSPEKSQNLAEKFDIKTEPQILSETYFHYQDGSKQLDIDLNSGNFAFIETASPSGQQDLDNDNKIAQDFEKVLANLEVFKEDLKKGRTKVSLLKDDGGKLFFTQLRSEAVGAQVSLWPAPIDGKPIFTPQFDTSLINAQIVKNADDLRNYLLLDFTYYPIDTSTFATYPLKNTEEAFEDLKTGKGIIIIEPLKPNVSITSVYLGYFLAEKYNPYIQPIFVFEGPHFVSYVSAINSTFMTTNESIPAR